MTPSADIEMQIAAREGRVLLLFSRRTDDGVLRRAETDNMILNPEIAMLAAQKMTDMAFEADASLKPVGPALKASLIEKHRSVLHPRLTMMLNSLRENKTVANEHLAMQMLDAMCAEVFT